MKKRYRVQRGETVRYMYGDNPWSVIKLLRVSGITGSLSIRLAVEGEEN